MGKKLKKITEKWADIPMREAVGVIREKKSIRQVTEAFNVSLSFPQRRF
jgi:hypothetical protein